MPRDLAHRGQDPGVTNAAIDQLRANHSFALRPEQIALRWRVHDIHRLAVGHLSAASRSWHKSTVILSEAKDLCISPRRPDCLRVHRSFASLRMTCRLFRE